MGAALDHEREKQIPPSFSPLSRLRTGRNDMGLWAAGWATAGAAAWAGTAVLARMGIARLGVIELMFLFAPLVIVPLGMELGRLNGGANIGWARSVEDAAQILQPVGAALAVTAMLLPPGREAGLVALGWMVVCGLTAVGGVGRIVLSAWGSRENRTGDSPVPTRVVPTQVWEIAGSVARVDLAVGGAWLVASRLGLRPMGIQEPIGLLTAVHFHFAGFATAMIGSVTLRFAERGGEQRWLRRLVVFVILLPFLVAAGFVISPWLKMAAAIAFSASVAGLAMFVWKFSARVEDETARGFLRVAAGTVLAGMALSGTYAVVDFVRSEALTIPRMASTHGVLNAMGFCLLGLLGWLVAWTSGDLTTEDTMGTGDFADRSIRATR